jgi:integrase
MSRLVGGDTTPVATYQTARDAFLGRSKAMGHETYLNRRSALRSFDAYLDQLGTAGCVDSPLEDMSRPMVAGYRDFCLAKGQAAGTVRQRLEVLHLLWEEAIRDGLARHNPVTGVFVREPKPRVKEQAKKRVALSMTEGVKLVDAAAVDELVAIVVGLDTGARIGDAFGIEASRVDLEQGKIQFWVEKSDVWHTVYLFPPTMEFLREFLGHHHPARLDRDLMRGDSSFLMPSLGVPSGPDVEAAAHKSALTSTDDVIGALVERAGIGEWVTRPSGSRFHTVRYHVFRITNNNALKMNGVTTEWVMARMCQKSKKANEAYDRADEHNVRKAVFGQLGILEAEQRSENARETKVKDGSMTFTEMMELMRYATRRLAGLRLGHKPEPPPQQMTLNGFI